MHIIGMLGLSEWFKMLEAKRIGLCAGWEIEFRLPGTAADLKY